MRTLWLVYLFCVCTVIASACEYFPQDCSLPFNYSLFGKTIHFPLTVDQAVFKYALIKSSRYTILNDSTDAKKANLSVHTIGPYDYLRYAPRTERASRPYYNKDIFAIEMHLRDRSLPIHKVLEKLQRDFKKSFTKKRTRMDRVGDYYQLDLNDCISVLVYDAPIFNYRYGSGTVNILFTYKLVTEEKILLLETNGSIRGD